MSGEVPRVSGGIGVWLAGGATVVAAVVRLAGLTTQSFWLDEQLSAELAQRSVGAILWRPDGETPLHGLLLHALVRLGADSDWWMRLPSALAGITAVPLLYRVGLRVEDRLVGGLAALLLALNPLAVWYSQEARAYSILVLCALASALAFLRLLEGDARGRAIVAHAASTLIGLGTHYYFVFVLAAQACVAGWDAIRHAERRPLWWRAVFATGCASVVWLPCFWSDVSYQSGHDRQVPFSWFALPYTGLVFTGGFSLGPPLRDLHPGARLGAPIGAVVLQHLPVVALALAAAAGLVALGFARRLTVRRWLVLLSMGFAVAGPWLVSLFLVAYRPRYALPALPFVLLWAASGIRGRFPRAAGTLLILFGALGLVGLVRIHDVTYAREDNRGAAAYVDEHAGDAVVLLLGEGTGSFARYAPQGLQLFEIGSTQARNASALADVLPPSGDERPVILVASRPWTVDPEQRVRGLLDVALVLHDEAGFAGVSVRMYVRSEPQ